MTMSKSDYKLDDLDYNPYKVIPQIGWWVTFCCDHDAHQIKNQEDIDDFLQCPTGKDGGRLYEGEDCKAFRTIEDCVVYENDGGWTNGSTGQREGYTSRTDPAFITRCNTQREYSQKYYPDYKEQSLQSKEEECPKRQKLVYSKHRWISEYDGETTAVLECKNCGKVIPKQSLQSKEEKKEKV